MIANNVVAPFSFEWNEPSGCKIKITFSREDDIAISLPKAPYAGFSLDKLTTRSSINLMINDLQAQSSEQGIKKLIIRQRPDFEQSKGSNLLHECLIKNDYRITQEVNQHVELNHAGPPIIHDMQRRKILKCYAESLIFTKESSDKIDQIHSFLAQCRAQQGLSINIDEKALCNLFKKLPSEFECYSVRNQQQKIIAATILVVVNKEVIYNYLPGFDRAFKSLSPLSFLLQNLYKTLQERGFKIFDLGLSSQQGTVQNGLFTYKKRMGALETHRYNYEKMI